MLGLGRVLACYEADLSGNARRHDGTKNDVGRYLRFLVANGYVLSEVEQYAISKKAA